MAHHLDDQVETFFLRLMRGSGLRGLSGMPAERRLGGGRLLRPLLDVTQDSIAGYAQQQGLSYVEDPSNRDISLDRNFLRQEVLPLLGTRWSGYRQTVQRASGHVASALATLESNLPEPVTVFSTLGDPGLPLQVLTSGAMDVAAIRLRAWLCSKGLAMPNHAMADEFLRQLNEGSDGSSPRLDCGAYVLQRYGDAVYLLPEVTSTPLDNGHQLAVGASCEIAGLGQLRLEPATAEGIVLAEGELLDIHWRVGGERCRPQGRAHSQTLKRLLQERAVPPWWRDRIPILMRGGEMLAVGDLWLCESSRLARVGQTGDTLWQLHWNRNTFAPVD
jgi:tRNA(Ile)-lysidine synthase